MSRTLRMTLLAVAAALLLPGAAGAAAPSGVLADNAADGHIAAYGDVVAWNVRAGANVGYQLVVWQGGTTTTLPVTPSSEPFDVSAGRGPNGATWLVWTRCTGAATPSAPTLAGGCDVVRYDLSHPGERKVAGADTTIWNEHAPSIDGDHIAMARVRRGGALEHVAVVATTPHAVAAPVPGGVPATTCGLDLLLSCSPVLSSVVTGTALHGTRLAVATRVQVKGAIGICGQAQARLMTTRSGLATTLAEGVCGLSGQSYGPFGFEPSGALWLVRICNGDASGCQKHVGDPLRWNAATRTSQHLTVPRGSGVRGLAVAGTTVVTAVRTRATGPCKLGTLDPPDCFRVEVPAGADPEAAPLDVSGKVPPDDYIATRSSIGRRVVAPPAQLPCQTAGPAPQAGAELWAGAQVPGGALAVSATSGARTLRGTVKAGRKGQDGWVYTRIALGGRIACGRTWTLTYRAGTRSIAFRTAVAAR